MAQRTVALCEGKYIGIETIYTVVDGKQINIPSKLLELREKSQNNRLFCPCGCGTNLILVAGDKHLKEQHFREKIGTSEYSCTMIEEGKQSIDSKIVLKCWLDDKIKASDLESRVPIGAIEDTERKPEFTFLSREKKLAIRYWRTRTNIESNKLDLLTNNFTGIKVIYIVDSSNGGTQGQYPESLMKIQDRQGYCLLLKISESDYTKASISAVFYAQDFEGLWKEIEIVTDDLNKVDIVDNQIIFGGVCVEKLLMQAKENFFVEQKEIEVQWKQFFVKQEKIRQEKEYEQYERSHWGEEFNRNIETDFEQQEKQIRDSQGNRWIKCEICGKKAIEDEFSSYGGINHINLGICKECANKK